MSSDRPIDAFLCTQGFGLPQARDRARAALEDAHLTRPGKLRLSRDKWARATSLLHQRFALHCGDAACEAYARATGRSAVQCEPRSRCERCGGSANRSAEQELLELCQPLGVLRWVVVGGSPSAREELQRTLGERLELRLVDGTERRTSERARADLEWADVVLIWGGSELHHKVSRLYTQGAGTRGKVVTVARRGVAALLHAAVEHLRRRFAH